MSKARKILLGSLVAVALVLTGGATWLASYRPLDGPPGFRSAASGSLGHPWRGAIHVHSDLSDGAGGIDEIVDAAASAGLDFVLVTDHNPISGGDESAAAWRGEVLVMFAEEISTDAGHLLALAARPHRYRFGPLPWQAIEDIAREGGWSLVAHPLHARQAWSGGWAGTAGLEVANLAESWSRRSDLSAAVTIGASLVDRDAAALRLLQGGLPAVAEWDRLVSLAPGRERAPRPRVAIGAADAHGPIVGPLPVPSYADTLAVLSTLVWIDTLPRATGRPAADVEVELLAALRQGRAAVEVTAMGDARGFAFRAHSGAVTAGSPGESAERRSPRTAGMGEVAAWEAGGWSLTVDFASAGPFEIHVLRDGEVVTRAAAAPLEVAAPGPGTYRVEIYRGDLEEGVARERRTPWLIGNPIYLWPAPARTAAHVRRVPPLPAPPLAADLLLAGGFRAEHDGAAANVVAEAPEGVGWDFALRPNASVDDYLAMAWRPAAAQDWRASEGMVVQLRAEAVFRADLQVRVIGDDGIEQVWAYSVLAQPGALASAVPWQRFRRPDGATLAGGATGGAPLGAASLERVTGVFLVVTPAILAPGSTGRARLETLGVYGS